MYGRGCQVYADLTLLFLLCLLCCLCGFPADLLYCDGLDDSHSNCLPHVTYSEPSQRWEVRECLYTHGLRRGEHHDSRVTRLHSLGGVLYLLARTPVHLLLDVCKLAGDMRCVTVQHGCVAVRDLSGMVEYNNLSSEVCRGLWWFVLTVACHVPTAELLHRHVLNIESYIIPGQSLSECLVVHLYRLPH